MKLGIVISLVIAVALLGLGAKGCENFGAKDDLPPGVYYAGSSVPTQLPFLVHLDATLLPDNSVKLECGAIYYNGTSFLIERKTPTENYTLIATVYEANHIDNTINASTTYYYRMKAVGPDGVKSGYTNEASVVSKTTTGSSGTTDIVNQRNGASVIHVVRVPVESVDDNSAVIGKPFYDESDLPFALPPGYLFLGGGELKPAHPERWQGRHNFPPGKEADCYVTLPAGIRAEDLSNADIRLMEFIEGRWVIVLPDKRGKLHTSGPRAGYIGPDEGAPARLTGPRPWCWVSVPRPALPDTTPPSTPTGLIATAVSSSQINLSWTASTDNIGVAGYKVYRNGIYLISVSTTSYSNAGLTPATTYSYTVAAYDAAGNTSIQSNPVSATTNPSGPSPTLAGSPWPMLHHNPQHTGQSPYVGSTTNTLKWSYTTGAGILFSSAAIGSDGTIYVGSRDKKLYAINPDGTLKWSYSTGDEIYSSPAISSDGTIYVGSRDKNLYAINADGTLKWSYATGNCIYSSPTIDTDGTVYVGSFDGKLYAFNPDGTVKWNYDTGVANVICSPSIGSNRTIYIGGTYLDVRKFYALTSDGTFKWLYTPQWYDNSSASISNDGTIYVRSRFYNNLDALNPDGSLKWVYTVGDGTTSFGSDWTSPAIGVDGTIYIGSAYRKLYAINPSGNLKWSYTTGGNIYSSPAIDANGTIYVGCVDNKLYVIKSDGTLKWTYTTGSYIFSSPAIGTDGTIYICSYDGKLYAIGSPVETLPTPTGLSGTVITELLRNGKKTTRRVSF
ncbi:MAG: PQQ-binding-like beta-propeller repeat protein [Planctomycetes bacterium]|nr:PQQ-binding-like beta-propeller repeat protein [Planctomycetota bacterium]